MDEKVLEYIIPLLWPGANKGRHRLTGYYWVRQSFYWSIAHWQCDKAGGWWNIDGKVIQETDLVEIDPRPIRRMDADVLDKWNVLEKKNRRLMIIGWLCIAWGVGWTIYSIFFRK